MRIKIFLLAFTACCHTCIAMPSMIVSSAEFDKESFEAHKTSQKQTTTPPQISQMDIHTNVSNRFATTLVTSKVKNPASTAQEVTFSVILPDSAYISGFVMEIGGKSYKAYVKEKEEAKQIYGQAVASGVSAGHVAVSARDSNRFTVSVNVEAEGKATFHLTYEELLQRKNNMYELVINIHPGQVIKHLGIQVDISESRPLRFVQIPALRTGNEITSNNLDDLAPNTNVENINKTSAVVTFNPNIDQQRSLAESLGTEKDKGLSGQFVVQYDVERDPQGGEILVRDGYFVHFFAPQNIKPIPKHVVFILDTSGSMDDGKLNQVKKAMESIFVELKEGDVIDIVDFDDKVRIWNVNNSTSQEFETTEPYKPLRETLEAANLPEVTPIDKETIQKAKEVIDQLEPIGATNIIGSIEAGIFLVRKSQQLYSGKYQPLIIFLTDGQPNVALWNGDEIISQVEKQNKENKIPIFSLSFGEDADKEFLRKLSLKNLGFSRHIYHASDAYLQLQDFYREISSPLLNNVHFKYVDPKIEQVTETRFPIYFAGSELVVAGRYNFSDISEIIDLGFNPQVWANGVNGKVELQPEHESSVANLERLWAYLTIKQLLDKKETTENKTSVEKQALDLALKYSFVTSVSSLVVVRPNDTSPVDTVDASNKMQTVDFDYDDYAVNSLSGIEDKIGTRLLLVKKSRSIVARPKSAIRVSSVHRSKTTTNRIKSQFGSAAASQIGNPSFGSYEESIDESDVTSITSVSSTESPSTNDSLQEHSSVSSLEELKSWLPWLANILTSNQTITIKGHSYKLGLGENVAEHPECANAPSGTNGQCQLLHECTKVYKYINVFEDYDQHFCSLEEFAGVCCPTGESNSLGNKEPLFVWL